MNRIVRIILISLLILNMPAVIEAEQGTTAYVSDILILTVRKGPSRGYDVFKTIESNEKLIVLKEQEGFAKIQLKDGTTGWVQSQYLTTETPDPIIISRLNRTIEKLKSKNTKQLETIESLKDNHSRKQSDLLREKEEVNRLLNETATEKDDIVQKFSALEKNYNQLLLDSKQVVSITGENDKLKKENKELKKKLEVLEYQNKNLLKVGMIKWFLAGAGVIFLGWVIGRTVSRKKSRYNGLLS